MRTKICSALILGLLLFAFSTAQASIQWTGDSFSYSVADSGLWVDLVNQQGGPISAGQTVTNLGGFSDSESDTASVSYTQNGLNLTSGAWGQQLSMGASVNAYTQAILEMTAANQVGVANGTQTASAFINRNFSVTTPGTYTLTASASGEVNWPAGATTGTATTSLTTAGGVTLTEIDTANGGITTLGTWSFSLNQLLGNSPQSVSVPLVNQDAQGNAIYYVLSVALNNPGISALFNNYDQKFYQLLGTIEGQFNAGNSTQPITISASLSPVPIPGSVVLLISGLGSLVVLRRKRA